MTILEEVDYVLEATSEEFFLLWKVHHDKVEYWNHLSVCHIVQIGSVDSRPICMTYGYAIINDRKILMWELTSELADYKMADKWLKKNCQAYRKNKSCNASNFHHILNY